VDAHGRGFDNVAKFFFGFLQCRFNFLTRSNIDSDLYELYLKVVFKGKGGVSTGRLLAAVNRPH